SPIDGPAVRSLTVVGRTAKVPLARSQAEAGWSVAVTGPLGAAAVALRERRPYRLVPRIEEGRRLNELGLCCGDVSDGLVREMEKFAAMAGVGSVLWGEDVPRAAGASIEDALTSGEEAELVCTGPAELLRKAGLQPVGMLTEDPAIKGSDARGAAVTHASTGYDPLALRQDERRARGPRARGSGDAGRGGRGVGRASRCRRRGADRVRASRRRPAPHPDDP